MRHRFRVIRVVLALAVLLLAASGTPARDDQGAPVAATPHFALCSDLATNLNDALIVAGAARNDGKLELFHSGSEDESCFAELPSSARAGWDLAVDYYARVISPARWTERQQYLLRVGLAGFEDELDARARRFTRIAEGFRMAATAAYEACRWSGQDTANRRWINELTPQLAAHELAIANRLEQLYATPWPDLPIRVDVVATAPPQGANSLISPPHILVSSSIEAGDALEIVHHEASHTLMGREDPIRQALAGAARKQGMQLPGDLWHVVLFYTTGDAVRRTLAEAGDTDYTPYMYEHDLWDGRWGRYREAIESTWPAYLDGRRALSEAASDLLRILGEPDEQRPQSRTGAGEGSLQSTP